MKTKLLTICLLLFSSISWGDELDGKMLICNKFDSIKHPYGFKFLTNNVTGEYINEQAQIIKIDGRHKNNSYRKTLTHIYWWDNAWRLDRKTLELFNGDELAVWKSVRTCEVYLNKHSYDTAMENYRLEQQKKIENIIKDNKI